MDNTGKPKVGHTYKCLNTVLSYIGLDPACAPVIKHGIYMFVASIYARVE